ncbi:hypothetical protein GO755_17735 [Spirosoma sp. HMF4905]|uniref:Phospholipase/carboxylesterase/thioesterase domain-containing protein n=1 Tax=Spirosoma arboris TaxID=2682092 RepID=A0A7K1SDN2_9BACT|nr:PHB depolymerase family esterase [Spirosoma arboris]MVM31895.1 hypothetical protein [Spirosoma arboris]
MKKIVLAFIAIIFLSATIRANGLMGGDSMRKLTVDGRERTYFIHVPKSYDGRKPFPIVLVFHGGGSNATDWIELCGLNQTADQANFIAVYPNGTGKKIEGYPKGILGWNGGPRQPGGPDSEVSKVDDIKFTKAMLDDLSTIVKVDKKRVYATGMSMGAILVYRLASELSDQIAAIAPIAGPMGTETCTPKRPVPVIHFHGTADEAVPFNGGKGKLDPSGTDYYSVDYSIRNWVKADGCHETPVTTELAEKVNDGTKVIRKSYTGGKQGSEVILYAIEGGGHTWPDRPFSPELKILGKATKNISANELMWAFFEKHPMK